MGANDHPVAARDWLLECFGAQPSTAAPVTPPPAPLRPRHWTPEQALAVFECLQPLVVILDATGYDAPLHYPTEHMRDFMRPFPADRLAAEPAPARR